MTRLPYEAFVFVRRGDEFLVVHRSPRQGSYWHVIGGALEEGESWAEAAARELLEETGLAAEPVEVGEPFVYEDQPTPVLVHSFVVDAPPGWEPALDWEHDDYRWCTADEAVELLYWPEPRELLRLL